MVLCVPAQGARVAVRLAAAVRLAFVRLLVAMGEHVAIAATTYLMVRGENITY